MARKCSLITLATLSFTILLCSCYHVTSAPSERDQCINMKRKQLFLEDNRTVPNQFQMQNQRRQLERDYQQAGCYKLMREEKEHKQAQKQQNR